MTDSSSSHSKYISFWVIMILWWEIQNVLLQSNKITSSLTDRVCSTTKQKLMMRSMNSSCKSNLHSSAISTKSRKNYFDVWFFVYAALLLKQNSVPNFYPDVLSHPHPSMSSTESTRWCGAWKCPVVTVLVRSEPAYTSVTDHLLIMSSLK